MGDLTSDLALCRAAPSSLGGVSVRCVFLFCCLQCSRSCAGGLQRRAVVCQDEDGHSASDCDVAAKPPESNHCGSGPCPQWNFGDWGEVSLAVPPPLSSPNDKSNMLPAVGSFNPTILCGNRCLKALLQEALWCSQRTFPRECALCDSTKPDVQANMCGCYHCLSKTAYAAVYTS